MSARMPDLPVLGLVAEGAVRPQAPHKAVGHQAPTPQVPT